MQATEFPRAVAAAKWVAASAGLTVDDVAVLQDSNRLTMRLLPCDVVARVAPAGDHAARMELELARQLAESGSPVAAVEPRAEPRVHERDGFAVTLWTYYGRATPHEVSPADYADALRRLHAGMHGLDLPVPHFTDRIEQARQVVADRDRSPALAEADRELLGTTLRSLGRAVDRRTGAQQLLHGEPHPGNVLTTEHGLLFVDFETCCRGPVEFDLAHATEEAGAHYHGADQDLLRACRILVLAMVTAWRWDRDDQFPDGRRWGTAWLGELRASLDRDGPNIRS